MKTFIYLVLSSIFVLTLSSCSGDKPSIQETISYPDFYRGTNQVKVLFDQGDLEGAAKLFESLATKVPHASSQYYYSLAQKSAEKEQCELAAKYLELAIKNGKEYSAMTSSFQKIKSCKEEIKNILGREKEIHDLTFNHEYKAMIDTLFKSDNAFRITGDETNFKQHDSLNKVLLIDLYEKYGYPNEKIVGSITSQNASILMFRTDPDNGNEVFLPIFKKAYEDGFIIARRYAGLTDRRRTNGINMKPPYFYEMPSTEYPQMIESEIIEIDRRRDSIGLAPKPKK